MFRCSVILSSLTHARLIFRFRRLPAGLSLAVLAAVVLGLAARADDQGWVLTQKSTTLGDQYVYISPNGLKCVNPRAGFALVTCAPDWSVVLFNEKTRVYYQTTLDRWKQELAQRGLTSQISSQGWAKAGSANIAGLRATEYVMRGNSRNFSRAVKSAQHNKAAAPVQGAKYWVSDDITVPPKLADLLATAYGLPPTQNIPLRLNCMQQGKEKTLLDTYRMQSSPIPISYFQCPSGFKPVQSDTEVMMNDEQRQIIEDMAKELGDAK